MNPEDRVLLERTLKISEENNKLLRKMRRATFWAAVWGVIKIAIFIIPFVVGYLYLEPYFGPLTKILQDAQSIINGFK